MPIPRDPISAGYRHPAELIGYAVWRGIYKGRRPSIDAAELRRLRDEEKFGPAAIAHRLGIGRASVYRVLGTRKQLA